MKLCIVLLSCCFSLGSTLPTSSYRLRWIEICNPFGIPLLHCRAYLKPLREQNKLTSMYLEKQTGQSSISPFILEILAPPAYQVTYLCTTLWVICCLQKGGKRICVAGKGVRMLETFMDNLPGLNWNMEDMLVGQRREVVSRRRANAVKITGWQPDLNANVGDDPHSDIKLVIESICYKFSNTFFCFCQSCDLRETQMPVQHDSRRDYQQSGKWLLYREGGQNDGVTPKPLSLNRALGNVTGAATVAVEYSAERSVLNTNRPASSGAKMSHAIQTKCQEALNMIKRLIDEKGHEIMPFSLRAWRQNESSVYWLNISGTDILNFQKIYQRLDQRDYHGALDFVADVQLTFKCVADQYPLYSPIRDEVQKVEVLFSDIMKRMFPDTDFQQLQNQVQNLA